MWVETPSFTGAVETRLREIADAAHAVGAVVVVGTDPIGYGVLTPPALHGADIVTGDIQSLGLHQWFGGAHAGFIAVHDEPRFVLEMPSRLFGLESTDVPGEYGFGDVAYDRTSFAHREEGKEWVGTAAALWGIAAGVYLALMGPQGMADLGELLLARTAYAQQKLAAHPGGVRPGRRRAAPARVHASASTRPVPPTSSRRCARRASSRASSSMSTRCSSA